MYTFSKIQYSSCHKIKFDLIIINVLLVILIAIIINVDKY